MSTTPHITPKFRVVHSDEIRTPDEIRSGVTPSRDNDVPPTDDEVLRTLVACNGVPTRVTANLNISEEYVLGVALRNTAVLSTMMRTRIMMSSFHTLLTTDAALQAALPDMEAGDLGRTYAASLTAFTNLAGQFENKVTNDDSDDATAAKDDMLSRLDKMGKREAAAQVLGIDEATAV